MQEAKTANLVDPESVIAEDPQLKRKIERAVAETWSTPDAKTIRRLFLPGKERVLYDNAAQTVLIQLLRPHSRRFKPVLRFLGIPHDRDGFHSLSPYALSELLYRRYESNDQLIRAVCDAHGFAPDSLDQLALRFLLFQSDVRIRPEYRKLLFDIPAPPA
jgi:hypothetical protein